MSTLFIIKRQYPQISQAELLTHKVLKDRLVVSTDDEKKGLTVENSLSVGVTTDSGCVWFTFYEGFVSSLEVFGGTSSLDAYDLAREMCIEVVSEHEESFAYHEFPADTNVDTPTYKNGDWEGFVVEGLTYPYNRKHDSYFVHEGIACPHESDFYVLIDKIATEYEMN